MRTKPDIADDRIIAGLSEQFGLSVAQFGFLPIGNDADSAVYRVTAADGGQFLAKVRRGPFPAASLVVPGYLRAQGIEEVVAPIPATSGHPWVELDGYRLVLYPFIDGRVGWGVRLSDRQWAALGVAVRRVHATELPDDLARLLPRERYTSHWRLAVGVLGAEIGHAGDADELAKRLAAFWDARGDEIVLIAGRSERLAGILRDRSPELVVCHADLHAGNILVATDGALSIVDWDSLILAPRERDLMFIGGGVGGTWNTDFDEGRFRLGYGEPGPDPVALAYYRHDRIVEDTVITARFVLSTGAGVEDRRKGLADLQQWFEPGNVVERADRSFALL